jgi:hypothetical protein
MPGLGDDGDYCSGDDEGPRFDNHYRGYGSGSPRRNPAHHSRGYDQDADYGSGQQLARRSESYYDNTGSGRSGWELARRSSGYELAPRLSRNMAYGGGDYEPMYSPRSVNHRRNTDYSGGGYEPMYSHRNGGYHQDTYESRSQNWGTRLRDYNYQPVYNIYGGQDDRAPVFEGTSTPSGCRRFGGRWRGGI